MRLLRLALPVLLALGPPPALEAQLLSRLPVAVHARVGAGLPTGDFAAAPGIAAEPGAVFEIGGILRLRSPVSLYAAYQQERFGCGECGAVGIDRITVASGGEAGAEVALPSGRGGIAPWARAGVVRHSLRFSLRESSLVSRPGVGLGVGGGVRFPVGPVLLAPGVRYQRYSVDVEFDGFPSRSTEVSQLTVDVGVLLPF